MQMAVERGPPERAHFDLTEPGWLGLSSHSHQHWKVQNLGWRLKLSFLQAEMHVTREDYIFRCRLGFLGAEAR